AIYCAPDGSNLLQHIVAISTLGQEFFQPLGLTFDFTHPGNQLGPIFNGVTHGFFLINSINILGYSIQTDYRIKFRCIAIPGKLTTFTMVTPWLSAIPAGRYY